MNPKATTIGKSRGRPSKLAPDVWKAIIDRAEEGEPVIALAKEFFISPAAINVRLKNRQDAVIVELKKITEAPRLQSAGNPSVAEVQTQPEQQVAKIYEPTGLNESTATRTIVRQLLEISQNIVAAAVRGTENARTLHEIAAQELDEVHAMGTGADITDKMRLISGITNAANQAASMGMDLIKIHADTVAAELQRHAGQVSNEKRIKISFVGKS